ncbi:MAG: hypothetical protein QOF89_617 [Acidobacteriota bacterium]|jgi:hypothetical protein|nr:hypothetical protein [Acidobacteriota bacterium]
MHIRTLSEAADTGWRDDWRRQLAWLALHILALASPEPLRLCLATHLDRTVKLVPVSSANETLGRLTAPEETTPPWDRRRPVGLHVWRAESPAVPPRHLTNST